MSQNRTRLIINQIFTKSKIYFLFSYRVTIQNPPVASQSLRPQAQIKSDHFCRKSRFSAKIPLAERTCEHARRGECAERSASPLFGSPAKRVLNSCHIENKELRGSVKNLELATVISGKTECRDSRGRSGLILCSRRGCG